MSDMLYGWYITDHWGGLSDPEKEHNATLAMSYLRQHDFTRYAAAGIVGNMWAESLMNPAQWNQDQPFGAAYGLLQWHPYTKYTDWAGADWEANGPLEMQLISYQRENGLEFYPSTQYPTWTWTKYAHFVPEEGLTENETINQATEIWLLNYMRPGDPSSAHLANRQYHARYVFENCAGLGIPPWLLLWWNNKNRKVIP